MPVVTRKPSEPPSRDLFDRLLGELKSPGERGQPLVLQNPLGDRGHINVYVIWSRWKGISPDHRETLIRKAYHAFDPELFGKIVIASGMTFEEAIADGVLPVRIVASGTGGDPAKSEEIHATMIEEGAIETPFGLELRYPSVDEAAPAYDRLDQRFPKAFRIVEEIPRLD